LFKSSLTDSIYSEFISQYQSISTTKSNTPFVYVDDTGIRLVTEVVDMVGNDEDSVCALTMAEDGWMEIVPLGDA
jgi:hypothetical protein